MKYIRIKKVEKKAILPLFQQFGQNTGEIKGRQSFKAKA